MKREQVLTKLDSAWRDFEDSYDGLADEQLLVSGVTGQWSVRDIIAHVTWWEEEALKHLPLIRTGGRPPRYSVKYGGINAFNALMTEERGSLSLGEVRQQHDEVHKRLVEYVRQSPADLFVHETRFRRRLRLDTYGHYPVHARAIRKWRSALVGLTLFAGVAQMGAQVASTASPQPPPGYSAADTHFMQGMIEHHAQALTMTALMPGRTKLPALLLLAQRINVSQTDEIALMRHWLEKRHEKVPEIAYATAPADTTHHSMTMSGSGMSNMDMSHGALMPGMLTPEQLAQLASTRGAAFNRLFLEDMIRHHEGALVMVHDLFATNGAAQEPEIFQYASDVDADQRAEIMRMRALLTSLASGGKQRQ
ncbi:MAG: DUF305 domain-containing protein [Gemmatimonadaceae bacterium]